VSNALRAAATARSTSAWPPRATWAMTCSSIGETSSKDSDDPTRSPPIQCSVETSTPSISAVSPVGALLSLAGSFGTERYGGRVRRVKPHAPSSLPRDVMPSRVDGTTRRRPMDLGTGMTRE
jgi:hypothetical protein